jgi:hypothetical protein
MTANVPVYSDGNANDRSHAVVPRINLLQAIPRGQPDSVPGLEGEYAGQHLHLPTAMSLAANWKRAMLGVKMSRMGLRALSSFRLGVYCDVGEVKCLTLRG